MIYHGHMEPLIIRLNGDLIKNGSPTNEPFNLEILNQLKIPALLRRRAKQEFTLLVFDNKSDETRRCYLKLYKLIKEMDHLEEFTQRNSIATIEPDDKDLKTLNIFNPTGFAYYLTHRYYEALNIPYAIPREPKVQIIYCVGKSHMDTTVTFKPFPEMINQIYQFAMDLPEIIDWETKVTVDTIYSPTVFVKGITDTIEL